MDPITIGLALAKFAPSIIGWIAGDDAEDKAQKVVDIAEQVTGKSGMDAVSAIESNPETALKFQEMVITYQTEELRQIVSNRNKTQDTMAKESENEDWFVRRARPFLLWSIGLSVLGEILIGGFIVLVQPEQIAAFVTLCQAIAIPQTTAAAVCGVYMKKRSDDKAIKAGVSPGPGLLSGLFGAKTAQ